MKVSIIGAGLAGCEAAWQLARRGINVTLHDIKPNDTTPAHTNRDFAELVCSNSLRAAQISNAVGLLKQEMRMLDSLIIKAADATRVPAGGALAVDREGFSAFITNEIKKSNLIEIVCGEAEEIPGGNVIIATGPLTTHKLADNIGSFFGEQHMYFYDAAAPIVTLDSIDKSKVFRASRYGKGDDDYINCPMTKAEYELFYRELVAAQTAEIHGFEQNMVFDGCMPVESMAHRGESTLLFGPLKPVGLQHPVTGESYHAVVQLRQDNAEGTLYNIVGFQTRLKFGEQRRVLGLIPGLENAEFVRYGVMHRNTFINSPKVLRATYQSKKRDNLFFAGQMTGVEGYVESAASGLVAGINMARLVSDAPLVEFPHNTATGAMARYITDPSVKDFQPMNINFGIMPPADMRIKGKRERNEYLASVAIECLADFIDKNAV